MEKTFAHAALLSATVVTAYMLFSPPAHLSAQSEVTINDAIKVRKAVIQDVDLNDNLVVLELDEAKGVAIPANTFASTTVTLGNGSQADLSAVRPGMAVYVFGEYDKETKSIDANKIVIRNKSALQRTTMSRADIARSKQVIVQGTSSNAIGLQDLGLLQAN